MTRFSTIPERVRQIAILTVGTRLGACYELYAHSAVASAAGLSDQFISTLVTGGRPEGMSEKDSVGFDVAHSLSSGRRLSDGLYARAIWLFGQRGTNELIYLVAHYCFVSVPLNGFDIPSPQEEQL